MNPYILAPLAREDLREIWDHIAEDDLDTADRILDEIRSAILLLTSRPTMGHIREDLAPRSYRFWSIYSYLIIYRPNTSPLEIVRVWHGAQRRPRLV
jgi:plasmid stabilization system protein ParE